MASPTRILFHRKLQHEKKKLQKNLKLCVKRGCGLDGTAKSVFSGVCVSWSKLAFICLFYSYLYSFRFASFLLKNNIKKDKPSTVPSTVCVIFVKKNE